MSQRGAGDQERAAHPEFSGAQQHVDWLTQIVEAAPSGVFALDAARIIRYANCTAAALFGLQPDRLIGAPFPPSGWTLERKTRPDMVMTSDALEPLFSGTPIKGLVALLEHSGTEQRHWVSINAESTSLPGSGPGALLIAFQSITRQKQLENSLLESSRFIESMAAATPEIFYIYDIERGTNVYSNRNLLTYLGYTPGEVTDFGSAFHTNLLHPDDLDRVTGLLNRWNSASDEDVLQVEYRMRAKNGNWRWFVARDKVFRRNNEGKVMQIVGSAMDTTDLHEAELLISSHEHRLSLALEATSDGLWDYDLRAGTVYLSPRWYTMLGYEVGEFTASAAIWREMIHPEDFGQVTRAVTRNIKNGLNETMIELRLRRKDQSWCWVSGRGKVVERDADGKVTRIVGTHADITERKAWEVQLLREHEALEHSLDGIAILDVHGNFEYANRALCELLGYRPEELLGQNHRVVHTQEQFETEVKIMTRIVLKVGTYEGICFHLRKDGSTFPARIAVRVIREDTGRIAAVVAVVHDISRQRQLEDELRQSQKLKALGRLAGGVAHDFNNLLSPILGYGEMLLDEISPEDHRRRRVEHIVDAAGKARNLTRQLLAFSRKQPLRMEKINLNRVLLDLEPLLRQSLRANIQLQYVQCPGDLIIRGDISQLEMVLMNLVINAQDAMPQGGSLIIRTCSEPFEIVPASVQTHLSSDTVASFHVEDTGEGMAPDVLAQIFEPFYTTKTAEKGTGLGLSSVQGIIEQHGGYILVESAPNAGSTFRIYIPAETGEMETAPLAAKDAMVQGGSGSILVVEDEAIVRDLVGQMLNRAGYTVHSAGNATECLELLNGPELTIDLALLDVIMPDMNGVELSYKIKEIYPETPILYMSGYTDDIISDYMQHSEAIHLVRKPFTTAALLEQIRALMEGVPG
ncbi:MAG: PAS domain S-box protein [Candidatus Hydrogenedentes bacterium]|nr:PAS domain S-box protein [Candidatus Hydrogenedentota bacterium]